MVQQERVNNMIGAFVKRSLIDRRSGEDIRRSYNLDYFFSGGEERRRRRERRILEERRRNWVRVSRWCSVFVGAY
jgi:hypothetical protein